MLAAMTDFPILNSPTGEYDVSTEAAASRTIRATFAFESEDLEATRAAIDATARSVPERYAVDLQRVDTQLLTLSQRINTLTERRDQVKTTIRDALQASTSADSENDVLTKTLTALIEQWKRDPLFEGFAETTFLVPWLVPSEGSLPKREFEVQGVLDANGNPTDVRPTKGILEPAVPELEYAYLDTLTNLARTGLERVLITGVLPEAAAPRGDDGPQDVQLVRARTVGELKPAELVGFAALPTPEAARNRLRASIADMRIAEAAAQPEASVPWEQLLAAAYEMAASHVTDTLYLDRIASESDRELARLKVPPVTRRIVANQVIQREGDLWNDQSRHDVERYWQLLREGFQPARSIFSPLASNVILVALVLTALIGFAPAVVPRNRDAHKYITVALLLMTCTLLAGRLVSVFDSTGMLTPLMASAVLLAILTTSRLSGLVTTLTAFLLSALFHQDWQLLTTGVAMGLAAISSVYRVRRRTDITRAVVTGTVFGLAAVAATGLATDSLLEFSAVRAMSFVALNGIICLFLIPGLLSPLERLFGITTDIQLLEYSDLNNGLLRRLAQEVPATYAHSLAMGQLAEAACDAIGGNGLLARVSAYYHDIGKMCRPEYFIENQAGPNVHDELSPRLSARAIASHVAEGVEMAREFHLPEPIVDGIREHHGTMLISFFHQQAVDQQKHGDVREEDYRYPGPKPQSRETAVLMICDGVESGIRSMKNPNEERVREFVYKIIQARGEDRQFDECNITLRELDDVGEVIARRVMSNYHTRIAYPDKPDDRQQPAKNVISLPGGRAQK